MFRVITTRLACSIPLLAALVATAGGCGGSKPSSSLPKPLQNREEIAALLPKGVTLESPVVPNKLYGESSKTVEDALAAVSAQVKDGVLHAGFIGPEIQFDNETAKKPAKKFKKAEKPPTVIRLAH
jgi:hypothetical protein